MTTTSNGATMTDTTTRTLPAVPDGWVLAADLLEWAACECTDGTHDVRYLDPWRGDRARAGTDALYLPGGHVIERTRVVITGPVRLLDA